MAGLGVLIASPAAAKPCELDLQIVLWNAQEAFQKNPVGGLLHDFTAGLFPEIEESFVYSKAKAEIEAKMDELRVTGRVRQLHAVYSGRSREWYGWDPAMPRDPQRTSYSSDQFGSRWMLVVHLDDPSQVAVQSKEASPAVLGLARLLGADIRGRVYRGVFDAMIPSLLEHQVAVVFNTGEKLRCGEVKQTYDDTTAF